MTSKERMMLAINKEKPDRLPITIHQWQPFHLQKYMNGVSDLEAFAECGMDAAITCYSVDTIESSQWQVQINTRVLPDYIATDYTIETPEGILTTTEGSNNITTWVVDGLIKNKEDILLLKKILSNTCFTKGSRTKEI